MGQNLRLIYKVGFIKEDVYPQLAESNGYLTEEKGSSLRVGKGGAQQRGGILASHQAVLGLIISIRKKNSLDVAEIY